MSPAIKLPAQLTKQDTGFTLKLNKLLYREEVIQKALEEDKDWVEAQSASDIYHQLKFNTSDVEDVYNWMNYLIYLNKE